VSPTALLLAQRLFERDPGTKWSLKPEFIAYDGRTLPLDNSTVDRVVIYDAYHHVPNPARVLGELRRVLKADGIVAMSEPGRGHTDSESSRLEAATGVLENELVLEDIAELALSNGFMAAKVIVASNTPLLEIDVRELRAFMGGRGFAAYWKSLCAQLDGHHYILLFAGDPQPTTRQPRRLRAIIRPARTSRSIRVRSGDRATIVVLLHNAGDTVWLHEPNEAGWTRFGAHLHRANPSRSLIDFDWLRAPLPHRVAPRASVRVTASLPPIDAPGEYIITADLVIEGKAWFAECGSMAVHIRCSVY
jgi:SAM-dependent methyltransferase